MIYTIGIETDLKLVERLTFLQEDLGKIAAARGADSRWTRPEYMYIPIVHLGTQDEGDVPEINHVIEHCAQGIRPFRISMAGISAWPDPTCPRLIQIGVDMGKEKLIQIREQLMKSLSEVSFSFDARPYQAIMLMGRIITPNERIDLSDAIQAIQDLNFGGSDIFELVLYSADLSESGTIHHVVSRHGLLGC